ncbi:MAG TPA: hypothetical protein VK483_03245 [Chitinophagaceae bacterium]|nr:hypothetical protein [Chitinophagaceae bacterium]
MVRIYYVLLFLIISSGLQAQSANPFMKDAFGRPLYLRTNYIAEGSPFFYDEYCFAEITTTNGKVYPNVKVKIDLVNKSIIYMTESGEEMIATTPINQVKLMIFINNETAYGETILRGFNSPMNSADGNIYQVLEDGKAKLLKEVIVTYSDTKKYSEATITRVFTKKENFFALFENKTELRKVDKNKNSLISMFETKQAEIRNYIENQKLKCKSEQDLIKIFNYYNSI